MSDKPEDLRIRYLQEGGPLLATYGRSSLGIDHLTTTLTISFRTESTPAKTCKTGSAMRSFLIA